VGGWLVYGLMGGTALVAVVWSLLGARRDRFERAEDKAREDKG
jgi:hypothetical protein